MKNLFIGITFLILFSCSSNPKSTNAINLEEILIEKPKINYKLNSLPKDINVIYISDPETKKVYPDEVKGLLTSYYAFSKENKYSPFIKFIDLNNQDSCSRRVNKEAFNIIFLLNNSLEIKFNEYCLDKFINKESILVSNFKQEYKNKNFRRFFVNRNEDRSELIEFMNSNNRNIMIIDNKATNDKYEIGKILKGQYDKEVAEYKTLNKEESIQEIFANLLLLDQSTKRKRKLSRTISKELNHNSRTRKDVDSLFLSVSTQEARTIKPALDYSYFEGMEVFLINDWGEEVKFLKTDKDLEEVISIDFPFMLPTPLPEDLKFVQNKTRNFAIGYDSFQIVLLTKGSRNLNNIEYKGLTGNITFKDRSIFRRSIIFKIKNGNYKYLN